MSPTPVPTLPFRHPLAQAIALAVDPPGLPYDRAVEEIARIELDAGLVRVNVHDPAGCRLLDPGEQAEQVFTAHRHQP